jgi:hypothetical protein
MPDRASNLDITPASRLLQEPPSCAPERASERDEPEDANASAGLEPGLPTRPPGDAGADRNPAFGVDDKGAYAGRPDQGVRHTTGTGAGGATEWSGGGANRHPSRVNSKPPGQGA